MTRPTAADFSPAITLGRFRAVMAKVTKTPEGCWTWAGAHNQIGYAMVHINRRAAARIGAASALAPVVHRVLYTVLVAPVPVHLDLDHLCRNRGCVNPAHLQPVPHRVNCRRGDVGQHDNKTRDPETGRFTYADKEIAA